MLMMLGQIGALFTAPALAAAGAAAVSIPIAIHLLSRLRRTRVVWAAMRFLEEAWKRQRRRMQLEQWLLLLVRCLLLAVLGLALAGPQSALLGALGLNQSSRLICVVLDDSLTTQAVGPDGKTRFDALKEQAAAIVDAAASGDRLAVWTTSSPVRNPVTLGPVDRQGARKIIEALKPSYAKADMAAAMMEVNKAMLDAQLPRDRMVLAVVSDFALGSLDTSSPSPEVMSQVADRATLWLRRPNLSLPNVQITSLTSARGMLLASPLSPLAVPLTITLSRHGSDAADELCTVHVQLKSSDGSQSQTIQRELRWSAGQSQAVLNIEAPAADMLPEGGEMLIRSWVDSISKTDALTADDTRWMTLKVKQKLRVGLIDQAAAVNQHAQTLTQGKWVELALAPAVGRTMEMTTINPTSINQTTAAALSEQDVLLVLRPDLLTEAGWKAVAKVTQAGKLVWVFTPASLQTGSSTNGGAATTAAVISSASWPAAMRSAFDLPWSLGSEAMDFNEPLVVASDTPVPAALSMLGPDWQDMLRPVRVMKLLRVNLQTAPQQDAWLATTDGKVVMASQSAGQGRLIFLAAAIDPAWTNLMVKPLFVPLLHESLRGSLGQIARRQQDTLVYPGQKLTLPATWESVKTIRLNDGLDDATKTAEAVLEVVTNQAADSATATDGAPATPVRMTQEPVTWPGVYQGETNKPSATSTQATPADEKLLAVNINPAAGDTRATGNASLLAWFGIGGGEPWIDQSNPGAILVRHVSQADLGLPLLWTVLALLLLETILARRYSHSQATNVGPSWLSRWWQRMVS